MEERQASPLDLFIEFRIVDQLEEFANRLVVLLEGKLAEAQPVAGQLGLGVGGVARKKALVVSGRNGIQPAVIGCVRSEIEFERGVSGLILGRQLGDQQAKTGCEKKSMSVKHAFQGRAPALFSGVYGKQVFLTRQHYSSDTIKEYRLAWKPCQKIGAFPWPFVS